MPNAVQPRELLARPDYIVPRHQATRCGWIINHLRPARDEANSQLSEIRRRTPSLGLHVKYIRTSGLYRAVARPMIKSAPMQSLENSIPAGNTRLLLLEEPGVRGSFENMALDQVVDRATTMLRDMYQAGGNAELAKILRLPADYVVPETPSFRTYAEAKALVDLVHDGVYPLGPDTQLVKLLRRVHLRLNYNDAIVYNSDTRGGHTELYWYFNQTGRDNSREVELFNQHLPHGITTRVVSAPAGNIVFVVTPDGHDFCPLVCRLRVTSTGEILAPEGMLPTDWQRVRSITDTPTRSDIRLLQNLGW